MHAGEIVALDTPAGLLATLGAEVLELRVDGDPTTALTALRSRGIAGDDAFAVGSTVTVPLRGQAGSEALAAAGDLGLAAAIGGCSKTENAEGPRLDLRAAPLSPAV